MPTYADGCKSTVSVCDLAPTGDMSQGRKTSNIHVDTSSMESVISLTYSKDLNVPEQQNTTVGIHAPRVSGSPPKESNNHSKYQSPTELPTKTICKRMP